MNFTVTANANGPSDPNNVVARGADPLFSLVVGSPLRRAGLNLQRTPGGLSSTLHWTTPSPQKWRPLSFRRCDRIPRSGAPVSSCDRPRRKSCKQCSYNSEPSRLSIDWTLPLLTHRSQPLDLVRVGCLCGWSCVRRVFVGRAASCGTRALASHCAADGSYCRRHGRYMAGQCPAGLLREHKPWRRRLSCRPQRQLQGRRQCHAELACTG
jgi:hypothetical protein